MNLSNLPSGMRFKKVVSLVVAISFIFSNIALADIPKTSTLDTKKSAQITTDPEKIVIPRDYGLVKAKYTAKDSRKLVVHIQDAHCNYEAQSNIIKILECLIKNDGLSLISVEGADGFIDTSWFKAFPDADIRKEVADYFMKKGEITGPEFLAITSDYPIKLFGAETRSYYIENLNAFTSSYPLKEDTEKYFNQIKAVLNKLKTNIYSTELKDLDSKAQDYESKKMSFTDYVKYLETLANQHKIPLRQYENLFKLVSVLIYEKKINFSVVDKERATLIDAITKKLDKDQLKELVNKSLEFKVSKISSSEYYDYLKNLALKYGISLVEEYPNLFNYIIYNSVYSRIENEKLFNDIKKFEDAIKEKLFANDDQRTLDKLSHHINILLGLVNIRLLNGDFDYYKEHKEEFTYEIFAEFINKMATKFGFAYEIDSPSEAVVESMPKLEDFYAIAIKRDRALVDNTIQAMKKEDAQVSVLVTGGFHSEGITKLLEKQGMSYIVVCPNITKDVETPYIKILTNQRTPLEEILTDTGATTADAKNVNSMLAPYLITAARMDLNTLSGVSEISDRATDDLKEWAKKQIESWLPIARENVARMHVEFTPEIAIAAFNRSVDNAVAEFTATNPGQNAVKAIKKHAVEIKKMSPEIIRELLAAKPAKVTVDIERYRRMRDSAGKNIPTIDRMLREKDINERWLNLSNVNSATRQIFLLKAVDLLRLAKENDKKISITVLAGGEASRMQKGAMPEVIRQAQAEDPARFGRNEEELPKAKALLPAAKINGRWYTFFEFHMINIKRMNDECEKLGLGRPFIPKFMDNDNYHPIFMKILEENNYYGFDPKGILIFQQPLGQRCLGTEDDLIKNKAAFIKDYGSPAYDAALAYLKSHADYQGLPVNAIPDLNNVPGVAEGHGDYYHSHLIPLAEYDGKTMLEVSDERGVIYDYAHNIDNMALLNEDWLVLLGFMIDRNYSALFEVSKRPTTDAGKGGGFALQGKNPLQVEDDVVKASGFDVMADEARNAKLGLSPINNASIFTLFDFSNGKNVWANNYKWLYDVLAMPHATAAERAKREQALRDLVQRGREKFGIFAAFKPVKLTMTNGTEIVLPTRPYETRAWCIQYGGQDNVGVAMVPSTEDVKAKIGGLTPSIAAIASAPVTPTTRFMPLKKREDYDDLWLQGCREVITKIAIQGQLVSPAFERLVSSQSPAGVARPDDGSRQLTISTEKGARPFTVKSFSHKPVPLVGITDRDIHDNLDRKIRKDYFNKGLVKKLDRRYKIHGLVRRWLSDNWTYGYLLGVFDDLINGTNSYIEKGAKYQPQINILQTNGKPIYTLRDGTQIWGHASDNGIFVADLRDESGKETAALIILELLRFMNVKPNIVGRAYENLTTKYCEEGSFTIDNVLAVDIFLNALDNLNGYEKRPAHLLRGTGIDPISRQIAVATPAAGAIQDSLDKIDLLPLLDGADGGLQDGTAVHISSWFDPVTADAIKILAKDHKAKKFTLGDLVAFIIKNPDECVQRFRLIDDGVFEFGVMKDKTGFNWEASEAFFNGLAITLRESLGQEAAYGVFAEFMKSERLQKLILLDVIAVTLYDDNGEGPVGPDERDSYFSNHPTVYDFFQHLRDSNSLRQGYALKAGYSILRDESVREQLMDVLSRIAPQYAPKQKDGSVGAIRMKGGELTAAEHGARIGRQIETDAKTEDRLRILWNEKSVNAVISRLMRDKNHYAISYVYTGTHHPKEDVQVNLMYVNRYDYKLKALQERLNDLRITFVVIRGLKEELKRAGVAGDLIFHCGISRRATYIDEEDFKYLFDLPNGADIILEGATHEKAHIDNEYANRHDPSVKLLSESEIEREAPSTNVRKAILERSIKNIGTNMDKADMDIVLQAAVNGDVDAYNAIVALPKEKLATYFEQFVTEGLKNIPEDLFGFGKGYDVRGNAQPITGGKVDLTPINVYVIGKLLGTYYAKAGDKILVTGDIRVHTPILRYMLTLGAASVGVSAEYAPDFITTGGHNLLSTENEGNYSLVVQVSGSHGVPQKNGLKIKAYLGKNDQTGRKILEPLYAERLESLYWKNKAKGVRQTGLREKAKTINIKEIGGLAKAVIEMLDKTLPALTKDEIVVIDSRAGAAGAVLMDNLKTGEQGLLTKRGFQIINMDIVAKGDLISEINRLWQTGKPGSRKIAVLLNARPDGNMSRGIWDPSKPEALKDAQELVKLINSNLTEGMPKAIGAVFDGDTDRITGILEDGYGVPAFEMTLPYYQRFLLSESNQEAMIALAKAGFGPIKVVCDVRANSKLLALIDKVNKELQYRANIHNKNIVEGWFITTGYPPQLGFMNNRIAELDEFIASKPELKNNADFMEKFAGLKATYFTAEASGHNFFHISARYPNRVCDCAIAGFITLLSIRESITTREMKNPEKEPLLTNLFANFSVAYSSNEVRVKVPNSVKIAVATDVGNWMFDYYKDRARSMMMGPLKKGHKEDDYDVQPKEDGRITVSGFKVQLADGSAALVRWSNTGEELTTIFEGPNWAGLISIMKEITERLRQETAKGVDVSNLDKEIARLEAIQKEENAGTEKQGAAINSIDVDVASTTKALEIGANIVQGAIAASINKVMLLNDFAESVGIKKDKALENMVKAGMATIVDEKKVTYELTNDFFAATKLNEFVKLQIASSDNPAMVDLTTLRIERIIMNSVDVGKFITTLSAGKASDSIVARLLDENIFPTLMATWKSARASKAATSGATVALAAKDISIPQAAGFYQENGVEVVFNVPANVSVSAAMLEALKGYQAVMGADMARGGYNYRGTGTKQTIEQFFNDYFMKEWYEAIRSFVRDRFNEKEPLEAILTNGIGANDQFMWSLANMYNANKPAGAPTWYHVTTAREFARLVSEGKLKPANSLFIDISRSGGTWEGVEIGIRSVDLGFNKRIALANGGAVKAITMEAARRGGYQPLVIGMSPDIGGRNMHRKTTIYYTAQTVAGMFLPSMDSTKFAALHHQFDTANDFGAPENSLPVSTGRFLQGAMRLLGTEHIAFITNTESLRLVGTEWEQYIMEGSNKEDVISMGAHDLTKEPEYVLQNLANSPAGKISIGMIILDKSAPGYEKHLARVDALKNKMPLMVFTVDSQKAVSEGFKGGISPTQQAAFDILWTDMVTVFTTLLRVDANSNPNVKLVREYTAQRVAKWKEAQAAYDKDAIAGRKGEVLLSYGSPAESKIGSEGNQLVMTQANAAEKGRELAAELVQKGLLNGRNRLNLFTGREDLLDLVSELRNDAYASDLGAKAGWIIQTALFPIWSHKGLEANLAYSDNPEKPLLANRTLNIFFNARKLGPADINDQKFNDIELMVKDKRLYEGINGATIHQTNDAMTIPNIMRMAQVSPTILLEFNDKTENVEAIIKAFYNAFIEELGKQVEINKAQEFRKPQVGSAKPEDGQADIPKAETPASLEGLTETEQAFMNAGLKQVVTDAISRAQTAQELTPETMESIMKQAAGLSSTLSAVSAPEMTKKIVLVGHDTSLDAASNTTARVVEETVNRYLDDTFIEVRASGSNLAAKIQEVAASIAKERNINIKDIFIATVAGDDTVKELTGRPELANLGKVLQIQNKVSDTEMLPVPVIGLYDFILRMAYGQSDEDILACLNRIASKGPNQPFVKEDIDQLLNNIVGLLRIIPKAAPVNMSEVAEINRAAQAVARAL
ncbi:MAG: hypothetical protein Q8R38_00790 [Candidatus Omnitrophota bacterium]|nr:hypothetical protein [Candidatus Omnitrophota bacterium]